MRRKKLFVVGYILKVFKTCKMFYLSYVKVKEAES